MKTVRWRSLGGTWVYIANMIGNGNCMKVPKYVYLCFIDYTNILLCKSRDVVNSPLKCFELPYLPTEAISWLETAIKTIWNHSGVQNLEKRTSQLYTVTLFIMLYAEYMMKNDGLQEIEIEIRSCGKKHQ